MCFFCVAGGPGDAGDHSGVDDHQPHQDQLMQPPPSGDWNGVADQHHDDVTDPVPPVQTAAPLLFDPNRFAAAGGVPTTRRNKYA